jgi:hypothetical protein
MSFVIEDQEDHSQKNTDDVKKYYQAPSMIVISNEKNIHGGAGGSAENSSGLWHNS